MTNEAVRPNHNQATIMEGDGSAWHSRMEKLMQDDTQIIVLRGAGTVNGIEPGAAETATGMLRDYVKYLSDQGRKVALMFDGDSDNRQRPDIGSVFGGLADSLKDDPNMYFLAAQSKSWYSPENEGDPTASATGTPYETYVFTNGDHADFTQSPKLATYRNYEQVFVGPAGPIAFSQLEDLGRKAAERSLDAGNVRVTILGTPNNPAVGEDLDGKLAAAPDDAARAKVQAKIDQRSHAPNGALFTNEGQFAVNETNYPNIDFNVRYIDVQQ